MSPDVEMQDAPTVVGEHQEDVQDLESEGGRGEEIHRDQAAEVLVEGRSASLRGIRRLRPAQRKKVEARAAQLIAEEMTLRELRRVRKLTQVRLAKVQQRASIRFDYWQPAGQ